MSKFSTSPPVGDFLKLRKARKEARERFLAGRKAESFYRRQLHQISRQVDSLVRGMAHDLPEFGYWTALLIKTATGQ
jgi:hypothetical protein